MTATLQLIAILVLGYVSNHFVARRLRARFHIVTGIEYLVVGVLVGPHVAGFMNDQVMGQIQPVMSVVLGALGLVLGLRFRFARLIAHHGQALLVAFFCVGTTALLVGGAAVLVILRFFHPSQWAVALPSAVAMGIVAAVSGPELIRSVRREMDGGGSLGEVLETSARLGQVLVIVLFGLVFCAFHVGETTLSRAPTAVEWMVANLGFGVALGMLFFLFLGSERDRDRVLLALLGIVLFASGTAYYLHLSPLFITLALGVTLSNTSTGTDEIGTVLKTLEAPLIVLVLVVAGASWNLGTLGHPVVWGLVALTVFGRQASLALGGWLAFRYSPESARLTPGMGSGLASQGGLAVAMAFNVTQVYVGYASDVLLSVVMVSVIVWELFAPSRVRAVLLDAEPALARVDTPKTAPATTGG